MFFSLFIFEVDFVLKIKDSYVCLLFLEPKLHIKQGTGKERIYLFLFIKCLRKKLLKEK